MGQTASRAHTYADANILVQIMRIELILLIGRNIHQTPVLVCPILACSCCTFAMGTLL